MFHSICFFVSRAFIIIWNKKNTFNYSIVILNTRLMKVFSINLIVFTIIRIILQSYIVQKINFVNKKVNWIEGFCNIYQMLIELNIILENKKNVT